MGVDTRCSLFGSLACCWVGSLSDKGRTRSNTSVTNSQSAIRVSPRRLSYSGSDMESERAETTRGVILKYTDIKDELECLDCVTCFNRKSINRLCGTVFLVEGRKDPLLLLHLPSSQYEEYDIVSGVYRKGPSMVLVNFLEILQKWNAIADNEVYWLPTSKDQPVVSVVNSDGFCDQTNELLKKWAIQKEITYSSHRTVGNPLLYLLEDLSLPQGVKNDIYFKSVPLCSQDMAHYVDRYTNGYSRASYSPVYSTNEYDPSLFQTIPHPIVYE